MLRRNITSALLESLKDTPVILLQGARQTGKSTLAKKIVDQHFPGQYFSLDDIGILTGAKDDPIGFLDGLEHQMGSSGPIVLDEVQRAPELFLAMKTKVDQKRRPGRYFLTGSANILLLPRISESLAGRIELHTLWPLSQGEIEGQQEGFIDMVFAKTFPAIHLTFPASKDLLHRICKGGYPEVLTRPIEPRRKAWFQSYITTLLQRDVRELANIESLTALPRLLSLLATRATGLANFSDLSRTLRIPLSTLKRYVALLEQVFFLHFLPAWSGNLGKRLVKAPKLFFNDTGLLAYLLGMTASRLAQDHNHLGPMMENFVVTELQKQTGWNRIHTTLFHYRTQTGQEVDVVLEDEKGRLVGIEVKTGATVTSQDFKGLRAFADAVGSRFHRGLVLYTGTSSIPFDPKLFAVPVTGLWSLGAK